MGFIDFSGHSSLAANLFFQNMYGLLSEPVPFTFVDGTLIRYEEMIFMFDDLSTKMKKELGFNKKCPDCGACGNEAHSGSCEYSLSRILND